MPKHVARSNNVKYTINPNNNYQFSRVKRYILNLYTYIKCRHGSHIHIIPVLSAYKGTHACTSKGEIFGKPK